MFRKLLNVKNHFLEIIVFTSGAMVMIFELAGSRVLGPYVGTSIFIWTSIIGVIMGSLSVGYWLGGRIADKKPTFSNLALIIFLSSICIGVTILIKDYTIEFFQNLIIDIKLTSVISSIVLFSPASVLLGMVSPYAVKLKMDKLSTSGTTVGNLYALSTVGSIVGTFAAGFYLIPTFGTTNILFIISMILVLLSLIAFSDKFFKFRIIGLSVFLILLSATSYQQYVSAQNGVINIDTRYGGVKIWTAEEDGMQVRRMQIENEQSSAMFLNSNELAYEYTRYYNLGEHFNKGFKSALMIGGAGYSYPKYFLERYPEATIDVVEIDPGITELAKKYFNLKDDPRLTIIHEDGRTYLNRTEKKYDVIYGDAFKSVVVPYQLTTLEAVQRQYDALNEEGVVVLNLISSIEGEKGAFLQAEYKTFKQIFPQVYIFAVQDKNDGNLVQNIILVALKSEEKPSFNNVDFEINNFLKNKWGKEVEDKIPILTDDHAPTDYYLSKLI